MTDRAPGGEPPPDDRPNVTGPSGQALQMRSAQDAVAAKFGGPIDAQIAPVLENCRRALGTLAELHADLATRSDMELDGETRWSARWQLSGAAIGYARTHVELAALGFVDHCVPTWRTVHETLGVLSVVNDVSEPTILDRWLRDSQVEPKKMRSAMERQALRTQEAAKSAGVVVDLSGLRKLMEQLYGPLSDVSHARRSGVRAFFDTGARRAVYGPHPDPRERIAGAVAAVLVVESTIIGVGDALASFYGGLFFAEHARPLQDGLMSSAAQLLALAEVHARVPFAN